VRGLFTDAQILVIGKRVSEDELCRILFHGVRGFVTYDQVDEQICSAVDALFRGHTWVSPQVLDRYLILSSGLPSHERYGQGALSPRESEIIGLLQRRLCDKEISSVLGVSEHTVRFHLQNIFNKLGVHDRYSVIEWARTAGLAGPENAAKTDQRAPRRRRVGSRVLRKVA
jgi:LuxR family transcriptional regulator of csgAB operon